MQQIHLLHAGPLRHDCGPQRQHRRAIDDHLVQVFVGGALDPSPHLLNAHTHGLYPTAGWQNARLRKRNQRVTRSVCPKPLE